ncbi:hypothetical protein AVEN_81361-1 [Araneus ventricosus]|uniref:Uncharacterized protein n=1 Tax=Araneus ventricosus TaxID=182803 RepID=A0A4Y2B7J4_ARAVE|nr:hypothetical protein AVEN_81361-1 [Araneus ventricosus]
MWRPLMPSSRRLCHLARARCVRSCSALLLGRATVNTAASVDVVASLASSSDFSFPMCPTWALIQHNPDVMSVVQRILNRSGYWAIGFLV